MATKKPIKRASGSGKRRAPAANRRPKTLPDNAFLSLLAVVKKDVDERLASTFAARVEAARAVGKPNVVMVSAARDLCLRGGKRMRAGLVVAGYQLARGTGSRAEALAGVAVDLGVAVELLQSYFLIHDDWMDQDDVRRGGPSVHAALTRKLRSPMLGERSAILAGDYTVALAQEVAAKAAVPPARARDTFSCFAEMQTHAVLGQQLDLVAHKDPELTYQLKTGSYSVRGPLRLGAILGGARPALLDMIDAYSLPVGVAFQLRDDLIGAYGDPRHTGKPLGADLTAGKNTALLKAARARSRGSRRRTIEAVLGNSDAPLGDVEAALAAMETCGAKQAVEARIDELVGAALAALGGARLAAPRRALLDGAARALTARTN